VVHTGVPNWGRYTRRADILVAAAGVPGIIQPEHVRPGSVVIGGGVRYPGRPMIGCWALVHGLSSLILDGKITLDDQDSDELVKSVMSTIMTPWRPRQPQ